MFKIYEFRYKDRNGGLGFVFYARNELFVDRLASRITALGLYSLQRRKIGYMKKGYTDYPPYELEQNQEEYVKEMENKMKNEVWQAHYDDVIYQYSMNKNENTVK